MLKQHYTASTLNPFSAYSRLYYYLNQVTVTIKGGRQPFITLSTGRPAVPLAAANHLLAVVRTTVRPTRTENINTINYVQLPI